MKPIKILILTLILVFLSLGCEADRKLGDACTLLKPEAENVTKLDRKNLDCMTVDQDALCLSYVGNESYCTQKCGPERTCADVQCRSTETCIEAVCYETEVVCSVDNPKGLCAKGLTCTDGMCKDSCDGATETLISGKCVPSENLCSSIKTDGICADGYTCSDTGKCEISGCPSGYFCESPIQLLGHPLKGMFVCVKSGEVTSNPCREIDCSQHGLCDVVDGNAKCQCNPPFIVSDDGLDCVESTK